MKILQVIDNLGIGGAAKVQVIFARAAVGRQVELLQASFGDGSEEPLITEIEKAGVPVAFFPASSLFDPRRVLRFSRFLRQTKLDVVQTHLIYQNIIGCAAGRLARVPVVCTLHSARIKDEYYHPLRFWLEIFCLKHLARKIIAVGESVKEAYLPHLGNKEILVVPNPIHTHPALPVEKPNTLRQQIFPEECRLAIAVGRLAAPKGYPDMIRAFARVLEKYPDARLMIVGGGELHAETQQLIDTAGLQETIKLLGEREDVPDLLAISDIFISASHWEGLPISILEAMAAGLPVAATRVGDVPRVVQPETGILVSPEQPDELARAIIHLLDDPAASRRMGAAGRAYTLQYHSPQVWMDRLLEIFQQAISEAAA